MALFLTFAALMIAAALAFVVVPLLRRQRAEDGGDRARRIAALDEALAAGVVDEDEYRAKRAKLDAAPAPQTSAHRSRTALVSVLAVALLLPAGALLLYRLVGSPQALDPANLVAPTAEHAAANMEAAIVGLAAKLKQDPSDPQGWALLGRAYQAMNRFDESRDALKEAHQRAPDDNDLTVEYAQALALASPDHRIHGESRALLEAVLAKDATHQRALWLIGISDYQDAKYDAAIATWNKLLPLLPPDSDVARSVRSEIADAEARRDGKAPPDGATASESEAAPSATPETPAPSADAPRLVVVVALDPKLKAQLDPDATLFVFARAAKGPPMPLAIQRLKASQLPATVTLDESMGMLPSMKLSMFPEIVVGARVSKSGNAMPQSGDLQTLSAPLDVHRKDPIALTIDQVVP